MAEGRPVEDRLDDLAKLCQPPKLAALIREASTKIRTLEAIATLGRRTCGRSNMNCPGAKQMREALGG